MKYINGSTDIYVISFFFTVELAAQSETKALARKYCTVL